MSSLSLLVIRRPGSMQQCPRGPRAQVISVSPRGDSSVRCLRVLLNIHHAKVRKTLRLNELSPCF